MAHFSLSLALLGISVRLRLPYLTPVSAESILWKVYEYFIQGTNAATEVTRVGLLAGRKRGLFCSS